uniref:Calponin-homology (CH) domain-containing protein n=2 Tax=Magallana gigas TaxID=29159 RepID=A0A8W8MTV6_MAGGI
MDRNKQDVENLKTMWKRDYEQKAHDALKFIKTTIDESVETSGEMVNFYNQLKNGVLLCKLVNALKRGTCTIPETRFASPREGELIKLAIIGMEQLGVTGLFQKDDLVEMKNLTKWLTAICTLQENKN